MKTEIYPTYAAFLNREDKTINGVSPSFAEANPGWDKDRGNKGCWNCSDCSYCSGCSDCSDCSRCSYCSGCSDCSDCSRCSDCSGCSDCSDCSRCSDCSGCSGCSDCSYCSDCSRCSRCSDCSGCSGCSDKKEGGPLNAVLDVPILENIHARILGAVSNEGALEMMTWHTCDTTHCRAGWVVQLAGEKGRALEAETSTCFAAMQIYKASSPIRVSPARFYESNEQAMRDIRRCAEEEAKAAAN